MSTNSNVSRRDSMEEFQHTDDGGYGNGNTPEFPQNRARWKNALDGIEDRIVGFEHILEDGSFRRRCAEDQRLQELRDSVSQLEKTLNVEIKRRLDANKKLQQETENMANDMLTRTQQKFFARIENLVASFELLVKRCEGLETTMQQTRGEVPSKLETDCLALVRSVSELRNNFQVQSKQDAERERQGNSRVSELERCLTSKLESERAVREEHVDHVRRQFESFAKAEEVAETQFRQFFLTEIDSLRSTISSVGELREQADSEILDGINQYASTLEKVLRGAAMR
eukprot:Platyproteum_vivax@DN16602_c0_g1_i1.p1